MTWLNIPHYRRLPAEMKATVANFNPTRLKDKAFLLRGKATHIRAFLSAEYTVFDNRQIAETVESLVKSESIGIKSFVLEETHCFLKVVSDELVEPASGLKAGIMVGNSEVRMGSVSVELFVFRKGLHQRPRRHSAQGLPPHAHIHFTPNELTRRMAEAIGDGFLVTSQILDASLKARDDPIPDPLAVIRKMVEERKMSQRFTDKVVAR